MMASLDNGEALEQFIRLEWDKNGKVEWVLTADGKKLADLIWLYFRKREREEA